MIARYLVTDGPFTARKPHVTSLLLGAIPFAASCFTVPLWDRIDPMVMGIPFNVFWLCLWLMLTPLCLWGAYRLESARGRDSNTKDRS